MRCRGSASGCVHHAALPNTLAGNPARRLRCPREGAACTIRPPQTLAVNTRAMVSSAAVATSAPSGLRRVPPAADCVNGHVSTTSMLVIAIRTSSSIPSTRATKTQTRRGCREASQAGLRLSPPHARYRLMRLPVSACGAPPLRRSFRVRDLNTDAQSSIQTRGTDVRGLQWLTQQRR